MGLHIQEAYTQTRDHTYHEWMEVINDPIHTENLKVVMEELARVGVSAGLKLRVESGQLWLTHTIAFIKAIK